MKIWSDVEYVYRCLADGERTEAFRKSRDFRSHAQGDGDVGAEAEADVVRVGGSVVAG